MSSKSKSQPAETPSPIGEISQEPSAFEIFLDANQKKLILVGILVILILIGYIIYDGLQEMTIRNEAASVAAAKTVPQYEEVSQNLKGKTAGGSALLLKTHLLWNDQQQQEAISTLENFIKTYPEHPAIGSAHARLGSYRQQLGETVKAKEAYQKAVDTESAASSLALLALGDLAREAGQNEEAKTFYNRILSEYETSHFPVKELARKRSELIGVASPVEKAPEPEKPAPKTKSAKPKAKPSKTPAETAQPSGKENAPIEAKPENPAPKTEEPSSIPPPEAE